MGPPGDECERSATPLVPGDAADAGTGNDDSIVLARIFARRRLEVKGITAVRGRLRRQALQFDGDL
jgi:hypothetical protein